MTITFGTKTGIGLSGALVLAGVFDTSPPTDGANGHGLLGLNAPAMLYGVARGLVATLSGQTQTGVVVLPTINLVKDASAKKRTSTKSSKRKPPQTATTRGRRTPKKG